MKLLKNLLLINWHFYSYENISFEKINFLTGKTGAGKSTIIDALQIVLLGDTQGTRFFNKAANDKSRRSLKGYLRGEYGDDGDNGFLYLRNGPFSSYILCEVYDTERGKSVTFGVVFDCNYTATDDMAFFILKDRLPADAMIQDDTPMEIKDFKYFLKKNYDRSQWEVLTTAKEYQEKLLGQLGSINRRYFKLLRQAVSFTPIIDIEKFITENICETQNKIDLSSMQDNLRQYKRLEREAEEMRDRITALEEIQRTYVSKKEEEGKYELYDYLIKRSILESANQDYDALKRTLQDVGQAIILNEANINQTSESIHHLEADLGSLRNERATNDVYQTQERLRREKEALLASLSSITAELNKLLRSFHIYGQEWAERARETKTLVESLIVPEEQIGFSSLLKEFHLVYRNFSLAAETLCAMSADSMETLTPDQTSTWQAVSESFNFQWGKIVDQLRTLARLAKQDLEDCQTRIDDLRKDIKPFDSKLIWFRDELATRLSTKHGQKIDVDILADLLEIKSPRWTDVIEGYLRKQKQFLLVDPKHYEEAISIYDALRKEKNLFHISLIDGEKVYSKGHTSSSGSLASEIDTQNPYARAYVDFLIGDLMKCDKVSELRRFDKAVTDKGLLYQSYVIGSIDPRSWDSHLIGRKSIQTQLEKCLSRQPELAEKQERFVSFSDTAGSIQSVETINKNEARSFFDTITHAKEIPSIQRKMDAAEKELAGLDLSMVIHLDQKIKELERKKLEQETRKSDLDQNKGKLVRQEEDLQKEKIPQAIERVELAAKDCRSFSEDLRSNEGQQRFDKEMEAKKDPAKIITAYQGQLGSKRSQISNLSDRLSNLRAAYNSRYNYTFNVADTRNVKYDNQLQILREQDLPHYAERITKAKNLAYEQFQNQFLAQMKQNIEEVNARIHDLNAALRHYSWGNEKFSFQVRKNPDYERYYDMITDPMLLLEGYNLMTQAFQEKHQVAIDELFTKIADYGTELNPEERAAIEKNVTLFTDYKTYLRFDMISTDENNRSQRLSRTLEKKSGGETQTPFYIAILASFAQLYRIHEKKSNTFRLIIFDEAFSKMDGERIRESIQLLRKIGFQCILSAPPEKIADIAVLVDHNIVAIRNGQATSTHYFDGRNDRIEDLIEEVGIDE